MIRQVEELLKYINEMAENLRISGCFRNWLPTCGQVYDAVPKDVVGLLLSLPRADKIWQTSKESRTLMINTLHFTLAVSAILINAA